MTVRISATDWDEGGTTATTRWRSRGPSPSTAPTPSTSPPARSSPRRPRRTGAATRPRTPTGSATRSAAVRHPGHRGRRDLLLRRRELHHPGGPRRPVRAGPHPPVRPALDAARGGRTGLRGAGRAAGPTRTPRAAAARRAAARTIRAPAWTSSARARPKPPTPAGARQDEPCLFARRHASLFHAEVTGLIMAWSLSTRTSREAERRPQR